MPDNLKDIEIRKLPTGLVLKLAQILEFEDGWKHLMAMVPIECKEANPPKYTVEHMKLIEIAGKCQKRACSEILLEEWGTSGKCRPTVWFLFQCLAKAELFRAADYVAELLNVSAPPRPKDGPAAWVKCPTELLHMPSAPPAPHPLLTSHNLTPVSHDSLPANNDAPTATLEESLRTNQLNYSELAIATNGFAGDRLVGGGAWGFVFRGSLPRLGPVAIKRLHIDGVPGDPVLQFQNEVKILAGLSHPNLLQLLGYSDNGPALCLVYRFMRNGSLLDRLACMGEATALGWQKRVEIAIGSAHGLVHLHTALPSPLVHRDVKSANILLDADDTPKLGDFGLVRLGSAGNTRSSAITTTVIGTSAYMAPEAVRGDVSAKLDVFSFGVVLLELITALPPHDESRLGHDLVTHIYETDDVTSLVDKKAGSWPPTLVDDLFKLAFNCLEDKRRRPVMSEVLETLEMCAIMKNKDGGRSYY